MIILLVDGSVLEHLLDVRLRADAHVLLAEVLGLRVHVGRCKLLRKGDLLQGQFMDASIGGAKQRGSGGEECALHDCDVEMRYVPSLSRR